MKRALLLITAIILASFAGSAYADSRFWLSNSSSGTRITDNVLQVAPGEQFTLFVFLDAGEYIGNTFEVFVGWDTSPSSTKYGAVSEPPSDLKGHLSLVSTTSEVVASINSKFNIAPSAVLANAREEFNPALGGRPYGLRVAGSMIGTTTIEGEALFSFTLQNNMPVDDAYSVVISDSLTGNSFTTAWINGTTAKYRDSDVLDVESVLDLEPVPEPSGIAVLATGVVGLIGVIRRRKK